MSAPSHDNKIVQLPLTHAAASPISPAERETQRLRQACRPADPGPGFTLAVMRRLSRPTPAPRRPVARHSPAGLLALGAACGLMLALLVSLALLTAEGRGSSGEAQGHVVAETWRMADETPFLAWAQTPVPQQALGYEITAPTPVAGNHLMDDTPRHL